MQPVLFEELPGNGKTIAIATLHAPASLNALTMDMVQQLGEKLEAWQADDSVACVILRGAGDRAFCAGADLRELHNCMDSAQHGERLIFAERFFEWEYRLDYLIHTYTKPIIAWGNGVLMGGGMGLYSGAGFRVVTESLRMAMPEITIGLFPDVGASTFLNRLPGHIGLFLSLTGAQLNAADARLLGMADVVLYHDQYSVALEALQAIDWSQSNKSSGGDRSLVARTMRALAREGVPLDDLPRSNIRQNYQLLQQLIGFGDLGEVERAISRYNGESVWLQKAKKSLQAGSPMTKKLVAEQLYRGKFLSLADCFRMEWNMAVQCCIQGEFQEGVRALMIDKDQKPKWRDASTEAVPQELFWRHFDLPRGVPVHPLADLQ